MTKDEALDLALEALEYASTGNRRPEIIGPAITAIKQARSAPVHKPYRPLQDNGSQYFGDSWDTPTAQPAPEVCCGEYKTCLKPCTPRGEFLAAQRQFVGLTDEEVRKINQEVWGYVSADHARMRGYAHAIEAKLKEKNT